MRLHTGEFYSSGRITKKQYLSIDSYNYYHPHNVGLRYTVCFCCASQIQATKGHLSTKMATQDGSQLKAEPLLCLLTQ